MKGCPFRSARTWAGEAPRGARFDRVVELNPHLVREVTPRGRATTLRVPPGAGPDASTTKVAVNATRIRRSVPPVVAMLTLQRRDGHAVRVTGARSSEHRIRLDVLPPQPHVPEARIRAVVPVLPHPRETTATIEILTDAAERPLRIPVRVAARR